MSSVGHFSVVTPRVNACRYFHRKGFLTLHHIAIATMQVANLVNLIAILQYDGNDMNLFLFYTENIAKEKLYAYD